MYIYAQRHASPTHSFSYKVLFVSFGTECIGQATDDFHAPQLTVGMLAVHVLVSRVLDNFETVGLSFLRSTHPAVHNTHTSFRIFQMRTYNSHIIILGIFLMLFAD